MAALTIWGLFKGLCDSNIFAALFDVTSPEARRTAAGFMNMVRWLGGGGLAPLVIGYIVGRRNLSVALASAALVYLAAGALLVGGVVAFVKRDVSRPELRLRAG
jgi:MFS family permease